MYTTSCDPLPLQKIHTLDTKRLMLRAPELEDTQELFLMTTDPEIAQCSEILTRHTPSTKDDDYVWLIIDKENNYIIGLLAIFEYSQAHARIELEYFITPDSRGKGFATEAALCIIEFCFNSLNIHRIQAGVDPENRNSIRVIEKCGMQFEGILHGYKIVRGKSVDRTMYAALKDTFKIPAALEIQEKPLFIKKTPKKQIDIERALQYPIPDVMDHYKKDYGVSDALAQLHERELKRFLIICAETYPKNTEMLSTQVDNLWHTFILFTKDYRQYCDECFGQFLDHAPKIDKKKNIQ